MQGGGLCSRECALCQPLRTTPEIEYQIIRSTLEAHFVTRPSKHDKIPIFLVHQARLAELSAHPRAQLNVKDVKDVKDVDYVLLVSVTLTFYLQETLEPSSGRRIVRVQSEETRPQDRVFAIVRRLLPNAALGKAYHQGNLPQSAVQEKMSQTVLPRPDERKTVKP